MLLTTPFWTLNPSWYLMSGRLTSTSTTGVQDTTISRTRISERTAWKSANKRLPSNKITTIMIISDSWKKTKQVLSLSQSYLFVPVTAEAVQASTRMWWTSWATLQGASHKTRTTTARAPSSFNDSPHHVKSSLKLDRRHRYLRPHDPRGWNVAVPALVWFLELGIKTTKGN